MNRLRSSSIDAQLQPLTGTWQDINGMSTLMSIPNQDAIAETLGIADVSCLTRFGVKGPAAAEWLASHDIRVSDRPNTWNPLPQGGLVARLGLTEFLIEDNHHLASQLAQQPLPAKVYPVLRHDLAIGLCGRQVDDLLRQTCSVNFRALNLSQRPVIVTSMIGVTVTVIPGERDGLPFYRIWCDGTFGMYFWRTVVKIGQEQGGDVIGAAGFIEMVQPNG